MRSMSPGIHLLFFLLAVAAGASRAHADPGAVIVIGKAPPREQAVVASAVRAAARNIGWALVEDPLADAEVAALVGCLKEPSPWDCVAPRVGARGIHWLIVVSLDPDRAPDGRPALALTEQVPLARREGHDRGHAVLFTLRR